MASQQPGSAPPGRIYDTQGREVKKAVEPSQYESLHVHKHGKSQPANSTRENAPATMKKSHLCMVRYGIANPCTHTWTNKHDAAKHIQDPRGPHAGQILRDYGDGWLEVIGTLLGPAGAFVAAFDVDGQVVERFPQMQVPATIPAQMQPRLDGCLPPLPVYLVNGLSAPWILNPHDYLRQAALPLQPIGNFKDRDNLAAGAPNAFPNMQAPAPPMAQMAFNNHQVVRKAQQPAIQQQLSAQAHFAPQMAPQLVVAQQAVIPGDLANIDRLHQGNADVPPAMDDHALQASIQAIRSHDDNAQEQQLAIPQAVSNNRANNIIIIDLTIDDPQVQIAAPVTRQPLILTHLGIPVYGIIRDSKTNHIYFDTPSFRSTLLKSLYASSTISSISSAFQNACAATENFTKCRYHRVANGLYALNIAKAQKQIGFPLMTVELLVAMGMDFSPEGRASAHKMLGMGGRGEGLNQVEEAKKVGFIGLRTLMGIAKAAEVTVAPIFDVGGLSGAQGFNGVADGFRAGVMNPVLSRDEHANVMEAFGVQQGDEGFKKREADEMKETDDETFGRFFDFDL